MNDLQTTITKLLQNKQISMISILPDHNRSPYASVSCQTKYLQSYDILLDLNKLYLLCHPFSLSSIKGIPYVRLFVGGGYIYLHQAVLCCEPGNVSHHIYMDNTLDNRLGSLQELDRAEHSRFHRHLRTAK